MHIQCPKCGSEILKAVGELFYEKGEFDGESYEEEGNLLIHKCVACGTSFCILNT